MPKFDYVHIFGTTGNIVLLLVLWVRKFHYGKWVQAVNCLLVLAQNLGYYHLTTKQDWQACDAAYAVMWTFLGAALLDETYLSLICFLAPLITAVEYVIGEPSFGGNPAMANAMYSYRIVINIALMHLLALALFLRCRNNRQEHVMSDTKKLEYDPNKPQPKPHTDDEDPPPPDGGEGGVPPEKGGGPHIG